MSLANTSGAGTMRALVVYVHYPETLSYFTDWQEAFAAELSLEVIQANLATPWGRRRLREHAAGVDVVILLHSVIGDSLSEIRRWGSPLLDRSGPLVAFVSNEVSLPTQPFAAKLEMLHNLEPAFIATQLLLETGQYLYAETGATVLPLPHALNPHAFRADTPNDERTIDIGFRGSRYLPHVGDDERNRIIDYFSNPLLVSPLTLDVRTNITYGRRGWSAFLNRCKATIGAEAGAIEIDREDTILERTETQLGVNSGDLRLRSRLRPLHRYLPRPVKNPLRRTADRIAGRARRRSASFPTGQVIATGSGHSGKCVSSRHFDAIGTETCQILLPGRYNDLLVPDRHYLCLEGDFSNIDDVLARFSDPSHRLKLVAETREWALDTHTYQHRVQALLAALGAG